MARRPSSCNSATTSTASAPSSASVSSATVPTASSASSAPNSSGVNANSTFAPAWRKNGQPPRSEKLLHFRNTGDLDEYFFEPCNGADGARIGALRSLPFPGDLDPDPANPTDTAD